MSFDVLVTMALNDSSMIETQCPDTSQLAFHIKTFASTSDLAQVDCPLRRQTTRQILQVSIEQLLLSLS